MYHTSTETSRKNTDESNENKNQQLTLNFHFDNK